MIQHGNSEANKYLNSSTIEAWAGSDSFAVLVLVPYKIYFILQATILPFSLWYRCQSSGTGTASKKYSY